MADVVAAGDLTHLLPETVAQADRLALLVLDQFRFAAELAAASFGAFASLGYLKAPRSQTHRWRERAWSSAEARSFARICERSGLFRRCPPTVVKPVALTVLLSHFPEICVPDRAKPQR